MEMDIPEIKKDLRQRIKLLKGNFDKKFSKKTIAELYKQFGKNNSTQDEFEIFLLFATHAYLDIKKIKSDRLAAVKTAEKFKEIAKSIRQTRALLKRTTKQERELLLSELNGINAKAAIRHGFRDKLTQEKSFRFPTEIGGVAEFKMIEPKSFFAGLQWMEFCAKRIVARGEKPLPGGTPMKLMGKDSNDHIHALIRQIKAYWLKTQQRDFSRDFLKVKGVKGMSPISPAAQLCVAIAHRLDPTITPTQVHSAMKLVSEQAGRVQRSGK